MGVAPNEPGPTGAVTVVVVTGGDDPGPDQRNLSLPARAVVVAADSGIRRARRLGLTVTLAVGDLDSATEADIEWVEATGGRVERHPRAKDETDLELALAAALAWEPDRLFVLGGSGGRLDHLLANAHALAAPALASLDVDAHLGDAVVTVVRHERELAGAPGDLVSLLAVGGDAHGVTTTGLAYPLNGETLHAGSSRGISNELVATRAEVSITGGVVVAIQPGDSTDHRPTRTGGEGGP